MFSHVPLIQTGSLEMESDENKQINTPTNKQHAVETKTKPTFLNFVIGNDAARIEQDCKVCNKLNCDCQVFGIVVEALPLWENLKEFMIHKTVSLKSLWYLGDQSQTSTAVGKDQSEPIPKRPNLRNPGQLFQKYH